jgi:RNA polymerase sigma factor (sigma-70 family)
VETLEQDSDSLRTRLSLLLRISDQTNDDGWREFYARYWRLIYHFSCRSGLNHSDAQDIVQEVLLSVNRSMPGFRYDRSRGRFRTWLLTIVRARLADHWRQRSRTLPSTVAEPPGSIPLPDRVDPDLEQRWNAEWAQHLVEGAMDRLRKRTQGRHYLFFDLVERQGMPLALAASTAGLHTAHACVIRFRLRKLLREEVRRLENF